MIWQPLNMYVLTLIFRTFIIAQKKGIVCIQKTKLTGELLMCSSPCIIFLGQEATTNTLSPVIIGLRRIIGKPL